MEQIVTTPKCENCGGWLRLVTANPHYLMFFQCNDCCSVYMRSVYPIEKEVSDVERFEKLFK